MDIEIDRNEYIALRERSATHDNPSDKFDILRLYFIQRGGQATDLNTFKVLLVAAIEDDPNLEKRIDFMYPLILRYMDSLFEISFLTKSYGNNEIVLLGVR